MFRTARQRLVAWNVFVLSLILAVLGGTMYAFYAHNIYKEVDQQLFAQKQREMDSLDEANGNPYYLYTLPHSPFEPNYRTIMANLSGQVNVSTDCPPPYLDASQMCPEDTLTPASKDGLKAVLASPGLVDVRTALFRGESQRVLTFAITLTGSLPAVVQISRSVGAEVTGLQSLGRLLLFGGLLGILLAGLGSFFLANRALVPIRHAFGRQRQFTADASHELRTPLALIRANAEMLSRHGDRMPDGDSELVTEIIRETDHLSRLVGDLLTLARADAERVALKTQPVDFRALVSDVHDDVQHIAESRGIDSQLSLDGPVVVEGDEVRLRQLLLILLDNALKYTDQGGHVDVLVQREDNRARLVVSDTGIGIPPTDVPHIFERFYRVDRAREHESGGTGLGLAIAQWIVHAHHGNIKVDSKVGQGTRFLIDLPASQN